MSIGAGIWATTPADILFHVLEILDQSDFLESEEKLPLVWGTPGWRSAKLGSHPSSYVRVSRHIKHGLLAVRHTCVAWRAAALCQSPRWSFGVLSVRWDEQRPRGTRDSSISQVSNIQSIISSQLGENDLDLIANVFTEQGSQAFMTYLASFYSHSLRRMSIYTANMIATTLKFPALPRLRGLAVRGPMRHGLMFEDPSALRNLLVLDMAQILPHELIAPSLSPQRLDITTLRMNLSNHAKTVSNAEGFIFASLIRLHVTFRDADGAAHFLRSITAPCLGHLELAIDHQVSIGDHTSIRLDVEGKSFPKLTRMWFTLIPPCVVFQLCEALALRELDVLSIELPGASPACGDGPACHSRSSGSKEMHAMTVARFGLLCSAANNSADYWNNVCSHLTRCAKLLVRKELLIDLVGFEDFGSTLSCANKLCDFAILRKLSVAGSGRMVTFEISEKTPEKGHTHFPLSSRFLVHANAPTSTSEPLLELHGKRVYTTLYWRLGTDFPWWIARSQVDKLVTVSAAVRSIRPLFGEALLPLFSTEHAVSRPAPANIEGSGKTGVNLKKTVASVKQLGSMTASGTSLEASPTLCYKRLSSLFIFITDPYPIRFMPEAVEERLKQMVDTLSKIEDTSQTADSGDAGLAGTVAFKEITVSLPFASHQESETWFGNRGVRIVVEGDADFTHRFYSFQDTARGWIC